MIENNDSVIFWWPDSVFNDVHWKKDPGSIPLELKNLGYKVIIAVGKFHSSVRNKGIILFETYQGKKNISIWNRLISVISIMKLMRKYSPKAIITLHATFEALMFAIFVKIYFIFHKEKSPKMILKLDIGQQFAKINNESSIRIIQRLLFSIFFNKIICESTCAYEEVLRPKPILRYKNKYLIIPNGFHNSTKNEIIFEKSERYSRILSVGRISYQKGQDILIRIFAKIRNKFPEWQLRIVGMLDNNQYLEELKNEITDLKVGNSVKILTDLNDEDIIREYESASIFSLLSRNEGFSIARVEAIHYGLPIVITEAGCGIYFKNFGSLVCNIENEDCIIRALEALISNKDLRNEISDKQQSAIITWH